MSKWLSKIKSFFKNTDKQKTHKVIDDKIFGFQSLTPTSNADESGIYCLALDEALNERNHFNIALTGGYGTGKSSIVETYLSKSNLYTSQNVIRISLANFNFRKNDKNEKKIRPLIAGRHTNDNEEQIALEISVLQQIIFQIQKKTVYRKFRKKIEDGNFTPNLYSFLILVTFVSSILFWNPTLLYKWIDDKIVNSFVGLNFYIITFLISFLCFFLLFKLLISQLIELRLSKFKINSIGLDFDKKEHNFSLNSHLDELIFLLKKGKVDLIIFEDLDRFNDHEIFEKLREINHVLRYSPDLINKGVKFLYIIRESIFKTENEKNKFFDIIVPVVPFISNKNAQAKTLAIFKNEIDSISNEKNQNHFKSVIKIAALCIDEMRTIKSIYNDYLVYLKVIEKNDATIIDFPKNELLAIIIYKNLFPLDFEAINSGTSKLELILDKRNELLNALVNLLEKDIKELKSKLNENNVKRINSSENIDGIDYNFLYNQEKSLKSNIYFKENEIRRLRNESFINIIKKSNKEGFIKSLLENLLIDELKNNDEQNGNSKLDFKIDLVTSLIIEEHINLNYKHYTSIFHNGDLSFYDRELYMKFKTGEKLDFDQHFDSPKYFLEQFTPSDWNNHNYFCEELFDEIINSKIYNDQLDLLFQNGTEYHLKFLIFYIPKICNKEENDKSYFIKELSKHIFSNWENFTQKFLSFEFFNSSIFDLLLPRLLLNQEIEIILKQNKDDILTKYISDKTKISNLFPKDKTKFKPFKNELSDVFNKLKVRFSKINESEKNWIINLIYENSLYDLNIEMIKLWGVIYENKILEYPTYTNVMKSSLNHLKNYVNENLDKYISDVLVNIKKNFKKWEEDERWLIEILNKDINIDKDAIIYGIDFFEFNLNDYDESLWKSILESGKIKPTWENLILYYEKKKGFDELLINIINKKEWIKDLDFYNTETNKTLEYDRVLEFWESLLEQKISDESLKKLLNKYGFYIHESIISAITKLSNLQILISCKSFDPETPFDTYNQLKSHFGKNLIHLKFAKKYSSDILSIENNSEIFNSLNKAELMYIVENNFPRKYFEKAFTQIIDIENLKFESKEALNIFKLIKRYRFLKNNLLLTNLFSSIPLNDQISCFIWLFENEEIDKFNSNKYLIKFKGDLKNLDKPRHKFSISKNVNNKKIVEILKQIGLINDYKIDKSSNFSFYRNQFRSFNS